MTDISQIVREKLAECSEQYQFRILTSDGRLIEVFAETGIYRVTSVNAKSKVLTTRGEY